MCHPHLLHAQAYPWMEGSKSSSSIQPIPWSQSPLGKPAGGTSVGISSVYPSPCAHGSAPLATRCTTQFCYLPPTPPTAAAPEPDETKYPVVLFDGKKMQSTSSVQKCAVHEAATVRGFSAYALAGAHKHAAGLFCRSTGDLQAKSKSKGRTSSGVYA